MSETNDPFGFGKLMPGFDFLQNLMDSAKKGPGAKSIPGLSHWIAPTLNVEELERRIAELKAVNFWLDQNSKALGATVQALEVQKMTLAALQGMNFAIGDVAKAFQVKPLSGGSAVGRDSAVGGTKEEPSGDREPRENPYTKSFESSPPAAEPEPAPEPAPTPEPASAAPAAPQLGAGLIDPSQWWGALTGQFQQIAANAMRDASSNPALQVSREFASDAIKNATEMTATMQGRAQQRRRTAAAPAAKKAAAREPAAKKSGAASKRAPGR